MEEKSEVSLLDLEPKDVPKSEDTFSLQSVTEEEAVLGKDREALYDFGRVPSTIK